MEKAEGRRGEKEEVSWRRQKEEEQQQQLDEKDRVSSGQRDEMTVMCLRTEMRKDWTQHKLTL